MATDAPTIELIHARVESLRDKDRKARAFGIRSASPWQGPSALAFRDHSYQVYQCDSPLEVRQALRSQGDESAAKVIVTAMDEPTLGQDILQRLAKRSLLELNPWEIVKQTFKAQAIDPRLTSHDWLAGSLLDALGPGDLTAVAGFLDGDVVWRALLRAKASLTAADIESVLAWSSEHTNRAAFLGQEERFRQAATEWLKATGGPAVGMVLDCLAATPDFNTVALGMVAGVLYDPSQAEATARAVGRFEERFLGGAHPENAAALKWAEASARVVRSLLQENDRSVSALQAEAERVLEELDATAAASVSDVSRLGFEQRLDAFGEELQAVVAGQRWEDSERLSRLESSVESHGYAPRNPSRVRLIQMASRLVRWFHSRPLRQYASWGEAADDHVRSGGYADWARNVLLRRDSSGELEEGLKNLSAAVLQAREQQSLQAAQLLLDWQAASPRLEDALPVESVLDEIVVPLTQHDRVLLIVLDGQSAAVSAELLESIRGLDWIELTEEGRPASRAAVATTPSLTEYSRTSLLCGRLTKGNASDETREFPRHRGLVDASGNGGPPVLFHKSGLRRSAEDSAEDVFEAIANMRQHVVGVVINAIDDTLSNSSQLDIRWGVDDIGILRPLLDTAREAKRLVVLVSDHGHVLDSGTTKLPGDMGQRHRSSDPPAGDGEVRVEGFRMLALEEAVILALSETVRYGQQSHGYHGGLSLQEMVVPITVLTHADRPPAGWTERTAIEPEWWAAPVKGGEVPAPTEDAAAPEPTPPKGMLFDVHEETPAPETTPATGPPEWARRLVESEAYTAQQQLAGRHPPADAEVVKFLSALDAQGGTMTAAAAARALDCPPLRLPGLLSKLERVLNLDDYEAIRRDETASTIKMDRALLLEQFEVEL